MGHEYTIPYQGDSLCPDITKWWRILGISGADSMQSRVESVVFVIWRLNQPTLLIDDVSGINHCYPQCAGGETLGSGSLEVDGCEGDA